MPSTAKDEPFFVGYAPPPGVLRRWLVGVSTGVIVGGAVVAWVLARAQRDPGPANWQIDSVQSLEGTLLVEPYPMVVPVAGPPVLLVGPTKQGAAVWAGPFAGQRVTVAGHAVERGVLRLFSIAEEPSPIRPGGQPLTTQPPTFAQPGASPTATQLGPVSLVGEIVDPKCFGGAMKPGDGKAHKGCASLCLRGGIPPVLIVRQPGGLTAWLLVDADGRGVRGPTLDRLIDLVGEPVRVGGSAQDCGGLRVLRVQQVERFSDDSEMSDREKPVGGVTAGR